MIELILSSVSLIISRYLLHKSFSSGFYLYFSLILIAWWFPDGLKITSLFGFTFYLSDAILVNSLILFFSNFSRIQKRYKLMSILTIIIFAEFGVSLARGALDFGVQQAVNESRIIVYAFGAICWSLFSSSIHKIDAHLVANVSRLGITALVLVETWNISQHGLGSASTNVQISDDLTLNLRPLVAIQAFSLLAMATMLLTNYLTTHYKNKIDVLLCSLASIGLVLSQQRSVWIATLITIFLFITAKVTRKLGLTLVSSIMLIFFLVPFLSVSVLPEAFRYQLLDSTTNITTYLARSGSWNQYLVSFSDWGASDQFFGKPFGSGWGRYDGLNNLWVEFNPHNWYIIILLRMGYLGLGSILIYYMAKITELIRYGENNFGLLLFQFQQLAFQNFYPTPWQAVQPYQLSRHSIDSRDPEPRINLKKVSERR